MKRLLPAAVHFCLSGFPNHAVRMKELVHTKFQHVVWISFTALIVVCLVLAVHSKVNWDSILPSTTVARWVIRMLESGGLQSTPAMVERPWFFTIDESRRSGSPEKS
jgi:hypothetical protein